MSERIPQSVAKRVPLYATLAADGLPATGLADLVVTISKNGAAFANPNAGATNATEIGSGWYFADLGVLDTAVLGPLIVKGTQATIVQTGKDYSVVDAANGGLSNLDATVSSRASQTSVDDVPNNAEFAAGLAGVVSALQPAAPPVIR